PTVNRNRAALAVKQSLVFTHLILRSCKQINLRLTNYPKSLSVMVLMRFYDPGVVDESRWSSASENDHTPGDRIKGHSRIGYKSSSSRRRGSRGSQFGPRRIARDRVRVR